MVRGLYDGWVWTKNLVPSGALWQEFVAGVPMSASLLVGPEGIEVLSVCRQLIGRGWCQAKPFSFCGAVELSDAGLKQDMRIRLLEFASALVGRAGLMRTHWH